MDGKTLVFLMRNFIIRRYWRKEWTENKRNFYPSLILYRETDTHNDNKNNFCVKSNWKCVWNYPHRLYNRPYHRYYGKLFGKDGKKERSFWENLMARSEAL